LTELELVRQAVGQNAHQLFGAGLISSSIRVSPLAVATRGIYRVTADGRTLIAKARTLGAGPTEREVVAAQTAYEHDVLSAVWIALAADGGSGLEVPRPRLALPDRGLIVMEESSGEPALRILRRWRAGMASTESVAGKLERCGEWLRRFSSERSIEWPSIPAAAVPNYTARRSRHHVYCLIERSGDDLCSMMLGQVSRRLAAWKLNGKMASEIGATLERHLRERAGPLSAVANVHGKFSVADVLVRNDGVSALDLEQAGRGSAYLDPAYFLAQMFMSIHLFGKESAAAMRLRQAFLQGRFPAGDFDEPLLESFIAYYLVNSLKPGDGIAGFRARRAARSWLRGWLTRFGN
jgi:hypothetical protein